MTIDPPMTPAQRRVYEARRKQQKRVESLNPVLQQGLPAALRRADFDRWQWKGVPKNVHADDDVAPAELPPVALDAVEQAQVSFERLKRCLRRVDGRVCRTVNLYCATECKRCRGRFVFDRTPVVDVPENDLQEED